MYDHPSEGIDPIAAEECRKLYEDDGYTSREIEKLLEIGIATVTRRIRAAGGRILNSFERKSMQEWWRQKSNESYKILNQQIVDVCPWDITCSFCGSNPKEDCLRKSGTPHSVRIKDAKDYFNKINAEIFNSIENLEKSEQPRPSPKAWRDALREKTEAERAPEREANMNWVRQMLQKGYTPWHIPNKDCAISDELRIIIEQQEKEEKFSNICYPRTRCTSIEELGFSDESHPRERLPGPETMDPLILLTGDTDYNIKNIIGDIDIDDLPYKDEYYISRLRDKLIEEGIHPPATQKKERERLRDPLPHRGSTIPSIKQARKHSNHRGSKEASEFHKFRNSRFKRHDKGKTRKERINKRLQKENQFVL